MFFVVINNSTTVLFIVASFIYFFNAQWEGWSVESEEFRGGDRRVTHLFPCVVGFFFLICYWRGNASCHKPVDPNLWWLAAQARIYRYVSSRQIHHLPLWLYDCMTNESLDEMNLKARLDWIISFVRLCHSLVYFWNRSKATSRLIPNPGIQDVLNLSYPSYHANPFFLYLTSSYLSHPIAVSPNELNNSRHPSSRQCSAGWGSRLYSSEWHHRR